MSRMFGTDGVRGIANTELTPELAFSLGKAGAYVLSEEGNRPLILVAKDTRLSGDLIEYSLCAGILSMGADVIRVGVLPTPGLACLVKMLHASAGVVISASHNPFDSNGIKFFNSEGFKLDDSVEDRMEDVVKGNVRPETCTDPAALGRVLVPEVEPAKLYGDYVRSTFQGDLRGIRLVIDCANGASSVLAEDVFRGLGAEVTMLADQPDGININDGCGSTHPEKLCERVLAEGADLGLAFDGDADRLIVVDEAGRVIDGDRIIAICMKLLKDEGRLENNRVAVTVLSNLGFHKRAKELGIQVDVTQVGDRYVLESMQKTGAVIGGEQSGHIIFLQHATTGDGMIAALQLLKAYQRYGKKMSELADEMTVCPQATRNAVVDNRVKYEFMNNEKIASAIREIEEKMDGSGRVLVRASGTEPIVRVMLEGDDTEEIEAYAEQLGALIEKEMA